MLRFRALAAFLFVTASTVSLAYALDEKSNPDTSDLKVECTLTRIAASGQESVEFAPTLRMAPERTASIRIAADDERSLSVDVDGSIGQSLVRIKGELTDGDGQCEFVPAIEMRIGNTATIRLDRGDGSSLEFAVSADENGQPNN